MSEGGLHRLSRYVLFVRWGDEVEVRNTATGESWRVPAATHEALLSYAGFRELAASDARWVDAGVLVPPYADARTSPKAGTEAALAVDVMRWYWQHEVESEREYTWLGWPIVKSPADIFFYQELIGTRGVRRILELGSGDGGGLWMFASLLAMCGGGAVAGVELEPSRQRPPFERAGDVRVIDLTGDAASAPPYEQLASLCPVFDLIVIDVGVQPSLQAAVFARSVAMVAPGGFVVFEDATGSPNALEALDDILLQYRRFGLLPTTRIPFLKSGGAVLHHLGHDGR